jgi:hypothetical protein
MYQWCLDEEPGAGPKSLEHRWKDGAAGVWREARGRWKDVGNVGLLCHGNRAAEHGRNRVPAERVSAAKTEVTAMKLGLYYGHYAFKGATTLAIVIASLESEPHPHRFLGRTLIAVLWQALCLALSCFPLCAHLISSPSACLRMGHLHPASSVKAPEVEPAAKPFCNLTRFGWKALRFSRWANQGATE